MNKVSSNIQLRITALWAFSEAFLGGILHAFHIPFAGLILSSFAVLCMVSLSLHGNTKGQLLKATILVIIIKAVLSPHTPVSAYFAVLLQGAMGELIFLIGLPFFISCLVLSCAALMQSAFQKLIILTLIFGMDFWKAIDQFLNSINQMMGLADFSYSFYLVVFYLGLHFLAGVLIGILANRLPRLFESKGLEFEPFIFVVPDNLVLAPFQNSTQNKFKKPIFWILILLILVVLFQLYIEGASVQFVKSKALKLILRSTLLLFVWYFLLAPVLLLIFQKWLAKQQGKFSKEVDSVLKLIPEMKYIVEQTWTKTKSFKWPKRLSKFIGFTFFMLLVKKDGNIPA